MLRRDARVVSVEVQTADAKIDVLGTKVRERLYAGMIEHFIAQLGAAAPATRFEVSRA